jgi:HSP20 family protein
MVDRAPGRPIACGVTTSIEPLASSPPDVTATPAFLPPADLLVDDEGVTVLIDVPGLTAGDLEIELENQTLSIRGERRCPYGQDDGRTVRRIERGFGRFGRNFSVGTGLDAGQLKASCADGVLILHVPRPESLEPRRVEIQGSGRTRQLEGSTA